MNSFYPQKYPVFEADQVLSQHHLNRMITYLDQQNRVTRTADIGTGIVCGMTLSFPDAASVKLTCGKAITSLGYAIETDAATYTHFHEIVLPGDFLNPNLSVETYLKEIFDFAAPYTAITECIELLESDADAGGKQAIPNGFFDDKIIIRLLQVELIDQKNCIGTNCDDKGKRMEFTARTLAITVQQAIALGIDTQTVTASWSKLKFPRYNVPSKILVNPQDIMNEFKKVLADQQVDELADAMGNIYRFYQSMLSSSPALQILDNAASVMQQVINVNKNSVKVQYLWDWLSDLCEAYNEIVHLTATEPVRCCTAAQAFPFHVVLGPSDNAVRTPFYPSRDTHGADQKFREQLHNLFHRLAIMLNSWGIQSTAIKITPSRLGDIPLSKKSIPFYYQNFNALLLNWDKDQMSGDNQDHILSYAQNDIQQPLLTELESYNFFRIEGHIGDAYKTAVQQIELLRKTYNLPFQITALNAVNSANRELDISDFRGRWDDLETDYDIARKRIFKITEFVVKWIETKKSILVAQSLLSNASINQLKQLLTDIKASLPDDLYAFLPEHDDFVEAFQELNSIFVLHRFCIQAGNDELSMIAEDLIDRFDDINELFLEDPLTVIRDEALFRWERIYQQLFFSRFMQQHPGLEHKAGVSKGGTFVIVYVDHSVFKKKKQSLLFKPILASAALYKKSLNITAAQAKEVDDTLKSQAFVSGKKATKFVPADPCKDEVEKVKTSILDVASQNLSKQVSTHIHDMLINNIQQAIDISTFLPAKDAAFEGMVIADFFLPYTLGGNNTLIEIKTETPEVVSINMSKLKFCTNDADIYEITVNGKEGGSFEGTAKNAVDQQNGKFFLHPAHASLQEEKTYSLSYQVDDMQSNALEIKMEKPVQLVWTAERNKQQANIFIFENKTAGATGKYEFDFGDQSETLVTNDIQVAHTFEFTPAKKEFIVTITERGKICLNKQSIKVSMLADFATGDFDPKDFLTQ